MQETPRGFTSRNWARCLDCEIRGDLAADGRPRVWSRIRHCQTCGGKGEIRLVGKERIDPMAKRPEGIWHIIRLFRARVTHGLD